MAKKNTQKTMHKNHLTAIIDRNITYHEKKTGIKNIFIQRKSIQDY